MSLFAAGDERAAAELIERSVQRFPEDQRLLFFKAVHARSYFSREVLNEKSHQLLRSVEGLDSASPYGRAAGIAIELDRRRAVRSNIDKLKDLVEEHPEDPLLLWLAGILSREQDLNPEGADYFERLLAVTNGRAVHIVHQTYANLLDELKRHDDALVHREQALSLRETPANHNGMANTLRNLGRFEDAEKAYAKAIALDDRRPLYWYNRARNYELMGRRDDAIKSLRRATRIDRNYSHAWVRLGYLYEEAGEVKQAMEAYRATLQINPRDEWARAHLADLLVKQGRLDEARRVRAAARRPATQPDDDGG